MYYFRYGRPNAQVVLRWAIQKNFSVIPKSVNPDHIKDNINIFDFAINTINESSGSYTNSDMYFLDTGLSGLVLPLYR